MRPLPYALVLAGLWLGQLGACGAFNTIRLQDTDYIRLSDWAAARGFRVARTPGARDVIVSNATHRIAVQLDASRALLNGTAVWLSHPVTLAAGEVHLARQDALGVLDALLLPRRLPPGKRIRTVCLDPGHGGKQPGHKSGSRLEKDFTLLLAQETRARLLSAGFRVVMTRRDDTHIELPERTAIAQRNGADLFVSLHYNAAAESGSDAGGIEVYAMTPEGARSTNVSADIGSLRAWAGNDYDPQNVLLAYQLQRRLLASLAGAEDRGVRRARFLVLRLAEMPAVLIEGGFMSNPNDARWIFSVTGRRKTAQAIVDSIVAFKKAVERR